MLFALGKFDLLRLMDDFLVISRGHNSLHEHNRFKGQCKHGDGWGVAGLKDGQWMTYRSERPVYHDDFIDTVKHVRLDAVLVHARKATVGKKDISNVQPFELEGDIFFTHNGTIFSKEDPTGISDSMKYFVSLMEGGSAPEAIGGADFTSVNFFLVSGTKFIAGQNYRKDPEYYTLWVHYSKECLIVSSEIPPSLVYLGWKPMINGTIIEVDYHGFLRSSLRLSGSSFL